MQPTRRNERQFLNMHMHLISVSPRVVGGGGGGGGEGGEEVSRWPTR